MGWFRDLVCPEYKRLKKKYSLVKSELEAVKTRLGQLEGEDSPYLMNPVEVSKGVEITKEKVKDVMSGYMMTSVDSMYESIEEGDVERVLASNPAVDLAKYVPNDHDCDDFAFALHGLFSHPDLSSRCFGWARSRTHAFNFFIDKEMQVWIVEPQTSRIFKYTESVSDKYKIIAYIV